MKLGGVNSEKFIEIYGEKTSKLLDKVFEDFDITPLVDKIFNPINSCPSVKFFDFEKPQAVMGVIANTYAMELMIYFIEPMQKYYHNIFNPDEEFDIFTTKQALEAMKEGLEDVLLIPKLGIEGVKLIIDYTSINLFGGVKLFDNGGANKHVGTRLICEDNVKKVLQCTLEQSKLLLKNTQEKDFCKKFTFAIYEECSIFNEELDGAHTCNDHFRNFDNNLQVKSANVLIGELNKHGCNIPMKFEWDL